jgi:hypothetical protein
MYGLSAATTIVTVSIVGGLPFIFAAMILGLIYWNGKHAIFTVRSILVETRFLQSRKYENVISHTF